MPQRISPQQLIDLIGTEACPVVVDVRRSDAFQAAPKRIAGAVWRDHMASHDWFRQMPQDRSLVVYCTHGHNVSALAAARLDQAGAAVAVLDGGIEAFAAAGGPMVRRSATGVDVSRPTGSVWVTRERPKIDRIACPWLIRRFVDPFATFLFVAPEWVRDVADELGAIPFDVEGVDYSHRGETCSFDTLLTEFGLDDPSLLHLARIVRGADTARLDLEPQAAGLLALSLGLSAIEQNDHAQLEKGMLLYDALYGWCRYAVKERHNWPVGAQAA
ncbi:sulfurtransferase [Mesorhizobium sp. L-8-10]|uniref:chromate resistance protein ChrB domain-containing protein n=1 Tax=Mesorhizobium sp. L-8-10 TaxID=2744523 RepID=UPI0019295152|nr:chromate resistance protein ChrB domain-containing protein [Mesorhizobium sp. L-8-10]BCH31454.1 sulfurtransferase [Mesorhizobium sp. L-8-10]